MSQTCLEAGFSHYSFLVSARTQIIVEYALARPALHASSIERLCVDGGATTRILEEEHARVDKLAILVCHAAT